MAAPAGCSVLYFTGEGQQNLWLLKHDPATYDYKQKLASFRQQCCRRFPDLAHKILHPLHEEGHRASVSMFFFPSAALDDSYQRLHIYLTGADNRDYHVDWQHYENDQLCWTASRTSPFVEEALSAVQECIEELQETGIF